MLFARGVAVYLLPLSQLGNLLNVRRLVLSRRGSGCLPIHAASKGPEAWDQVARVYPVDREGGCHDVGREKGYVFRDAARFSAAPARDAWILGVGEWRGCLFVGNGREEVSFLALFCVSLLSMVCIDLGQASVQHPQLLPDVLFGAFPQSTSHSASRH